MPATEWQKSSFSNEQDNCIELSNDSDLIQIREGDTPDVVLGTNSRRVSPLLAAIRAGRLNHFASR